MNFTKIGTALSNATGRVGLKLQKHSPEILMVVGITGVVGSTILACKATLRCEAVMDNHDIKMEKINGTWEKVKDGEIPLDDYSEDDHKKDLTVTYVQTGVDFVKLYGPSVSLGIASLVCIVAAFGIVKRRNVALVAAYKAVEEGFAAYRKRVVEEHGEQVDYMYKNGLRAETITDVEIGEDGKAKKVKKEVLVADPNANSVYARYYDETCRQWSPTPEYNLLFLKGQQTYYNQMLQARGHVFLNEVYDALGIPRTQAGAVVGWVMNDEGDNFVDFGFDQSTKFLNGYDNKVLLDFNVDGLIHNLI